MIELGKVQELTVVKKVDFGVYLGEKMDAGQEERVLLPGKKYRPEQKKGTSFRCLSIRILLTALSPLQTDQRQSWENWR